MFLTLGAAGEDMMLEQFLFFQLPGVLPAPAATSSSTVHRQLSNCTVQLPTVIFRALHSFVFPSSVPVLLDLGLELFFFFFLAMQNVENEHC